MNKLLRKLAATFLGFTMAAGVGVAVSSGHNGVSQVRADNYTITFKAETSGDGTKDTTGVAVSNYTSSSYVTGNASSPTNSYYNSKAGLKLGASGKAGSVTFTLASSGQVTPTSVVVNAKRYNSSKAATISINSKTAQSLTADFADYTFDGFTTTITSLTITSSNYCFVSSITVNYSSGGGTPTDSVTLSVDPTSLDLEVGDTETFDVSISSTGTYGTEFIVESGDESVATVSPDVGDGDDTITVTAEGAGTTTITVSSVDGDQTATVDVTVTAPESVITGSFNEFSGSLVEGDYVICSGSTAMKNITTDSPRIDVDTATITNSTITDPKASIVWHIAKVENTEYWTIYNDAVSKYAAFNSTNGRGTLIDSVTDYAKFSVSGSYDFINVGNSGKYLRYNSGYGFASYSNSTGVTLTLYKKAVSYTIQYLPNNGTEETMPNSITTVSSCTFTAPSGKEFDHWSTSSTDEQGSTSYAPGDSVSGSCTLYAIWKDKVASVSVSPTAIALEVGGSTKTVTATPTNIDNVTYQWARSSGDDCISLTNDTSAIVTVAVKTGFTSSGSCVLTVTASGKLGNNNIQRTADVAVTVTKTSTESNPYTVSEAVAFATAQGSIQSETLAYVEGYLAIKNSNGSQIFLTDNADSVDVTKTYSDSEKHEMLCVYKSGGVTDISGVSVGDKVKISGYPVLYDDSKGGQPEFATGAVLSSVAETMMITKTVSSDTLTVNTAFSYSGVVSIEYTHKTDVANANALVTFSGYTMSSVGAQTVTISYTDEKLGKEASTTYTLNVEYATVSSVTLNHHSITIEPSSSTNFSVSLNEDVDPASSATWNVANGGGSSLNLSKYGIASTGNLTATLTCTGDSTDSGILIVTATVGGISDTCTVTVTGDAYVTFNKESVHGIVGATIDNTVTVAGVGIIPNSWAWSVTSGSSVVSATSGSATTTLTFKAAGTANLHVVVSDGTDSAEGDIAVNVIESLGTITIPGGTEEHNDTIDTKLQGYSNAAEVSTIQGSNFDVEFDKGTNSNAPKYYSNNVTVAAVRVYGGGTMTVSSSLTMTKIELTFGSGDGSNEITTDCGSYSNGIWTGSSSSVVFSVGGANGNRRFSVIKIYWETSAADIPVSDINYNAQKAVIEFATGLTSNLNAVCDQVNGNTPLSGEDGLIQKWGAIQSLYTSKRNSLSTSAEQGELSERDIFDALIANALVNESGNSLEKALSSYEYVYGKYHASFDGEVAGSADFLHNTSGRGAVSYSPKVNFINIFGSETTNTVAIIVIISMVSMTAIGGYFFIRKRKEQ